MKLDAILKYLGLNNHTNKIQEIFNIEDISSKNIHFDQDIDLSFEWLELLDEVQSELRTFYHLNQHNRMFIESLILLRWLVIEYAHPSLNLVQPLPCIEQLDNQGDYHALSLIIIAGYSIRKYLDFGMDTSHITFNCNHLKNYINNYYIQHKKLGTSNYKWNFNLATISLIHLHTLHFSHHIYSKKNIVFKHRLSGRKIMLALEGIDVREDGQINTVNNIEDHCFITSYEETNSYYKGHYVNPNGFITKDLIEISKDDYEIVLQPGDTTIDFHIPTGPGYNIRDMKKSFELAKQFFITFYPEYTYNVFSCESWLYSPQIKEFITNTNGNIYTLNEQSYSFPSTVGQHSILEFVFKQTEIDFLTIKPKTSLEKNIVDFNKQGRKINNGCYLFFLDDLDRFGEKPYRLNVSVK